MKKLFALLLVAAMAICALFAFVGCDGIIPVGNIPGGGGGSNPPANQWSFDDDYHWQTTEADKELHTVENNVCTVCKKTVTHTVGLEYELVTPEANTVARMAAPLVDYEDNGSYYIVTGIGDAAGNETLIIPSAHNGIPVKEIGEKAFYNAYSYKFAGVLIPDSIQKIGELAFNGAGISKIFYQGNTADWEKIECANSYYQYENISSETSSLYVYFYTETVTDETGRYWYYGNSGEIVDYINFAGMVGSCFLGSRYQIMWEEDGEPHWIQPDGMEIRYVNCKILEFDGKDLTTLKYELSDVRFHLDANHNEYTTETPWGEPKYNELYDEKPGYEVDALFSNQYTATFFVTLNVSLIDGILVIEIDGGIPLEVKDSEGNDCPFGTYVGNDGIEYHASYSLGGTLKIC